jgi:tRNA threonylcarbamoyladenosine biosynthesis protein TsaE
MDIKMREIIASLEQIEKVVNYLKDNIDKNAIIFLTGDLASGKTTLTKEIAKSRGVKSEVTSPTFSLQQCYDKDLYHYDLYRIEYNEFMELGIFEEFDKDGWHMVEWGDKRLKKFLSDAGYNIYDISIKLDKDSRKYTFS